MSRLQAVLTLTTLLTIGCVAEAQTPHCKDGMCPIPKPGAVENVPQLDPSAQYQPAPRYQSAPENAAQAGPGSFRLPTNDNFSRFDLPRDYRGGTQPFSDVCHECGHEHSATQRSGSNRPYDFYTPMAKTRSRNDYADYQRDGRDYRGVPTSFQSDRRSPDRSFGQNFSDGSDTNCRCNQPELDYRDMGSDYRGSNYRGLEPRGSGSRGLNVDYPSSPDDYRGPTDHRGFPGIDYSSQGNDYRMPATSPRLPARDDYRPDYGRRPSGRGDASRARYDFPELRYPSREPARDFSYTSTRQSVSRDIRWNAELKPASQWAKQNGRPMVVKFTADWCDHCQRMKQAAWQDKRVIGMMNTGGFVGVRINADNDRDTLARLGVTSLPTIFIVNPDLKIAERMQGYRSADQVLQSLAKYSRSVEKKKGDDMRVAAK